MSTLNPKGQDPERRPTTPSKKPSVDSTGETKAGKPAASDAARQARSASAEGAKRHSPTSGTRPVAKKPRKPVVDDAVVAEWLGASDLNDGPEKVRTQTNLQATSKTARSVATSDDAILSVIGDRLAEKGVASFTRIGIDIKNGVVTIRGNVASKGERLLLMHILRSTPGVRTIQDGLAITSTRSSEPARSWGDFFGSLTSGISVPSLPSGDSFSSITESLSSLKPVHGAVIAAVLLIGAFFFWPRGASRVAVYPLKGKVVLEGTPMAQATVVLHPAGPSKLPNGILPRGTATEDGNLIFQTFAQADGSPEGDFVATVHLMKPVLIDGDMVPGPDTSPTLYRTPDTSPLHLKITRETKEISLLDLKKTVINPGADN